ncbi:MAG TPA: hypothetical protein VH413_12615 [Verrucomicrobiae bacterium]|nr:hypothetical protein [Verrucomicrobiae bacterium]
MKLNWKYSTFAVVIAMTMLCSGCGGFSASRGVSPLNILMPATLLQADPKLPSSEPVPQTAPIQQLAQSQY